MIEVVSAGFYTSIQDLGRVGFRDLGVPISGAMDLYAAKFANTILNNSTNDSVLEITSGKCKLKAGNESIICVSGANLSARLNQELIHLNTAIKINKDDVLTFDKPVFGVRAYLAIKGGFQTAMVLNSRSYFNQITNQHLVKKGDVLPTTKTSVVFKESNASIKINSEHFTTKDFDVYKGPEYELLSGLQKNKLLQTLFAISKDNNRMGYRLEESLPNSLKPILTSSVMPGTVQLTPSGTLIVLMRDCQVTGGYPRVLQLSEIAISQLAQKTTNDRFKFKLIA
tara:strand:+ start:134063 stop:134911 length:849 start_codon:yes stop_codon:yes gene_type:complete